MTAQATTTAESPKTTAPPTSTATSSRAVVGVLEKYALIFITIAVIVFFSVVPPASTAFPTINNFNVVLGSNAVVALVALAALFTLVAGVFDFSVGATAIASFVFSAGLQVELHVPLWVAIVLPLLLSAAIGFLNGLFVVKFKMNPFVTTLGMATLLSGVSIWYCAGKTFVLPADSALIAFGSLRWLGLPVVFYLVVVAAAVIWYFFQHTPSGRSLYAIGSNASSARLVGIRVDRSVWMTFVVSAVIAGIAGIVQLGRLGSATAVDGGALLFPALTAVFLGATAITPGFFNVIGTVISAVFVSIVVSGLTLMGASSWATNVFNGVVLLVAVGLSTYLGRRNRVGG
ncbi:ABC transporter permease [Microbacterium trichothecenolyticum]|jgi:ribose transport system permease protein|uniref:ABC transporter permease n=1 Tax=Microbacterium trichothecenolyticum TaxID=69370 RepID=UPI0035BE1081